MTFLEAALAVLRDADVPLTAEEITDEAIKRGLISSSGRTPVKTMDSVLYMHTRAGRPQKLVRLFEPGPERAVRGSVRWTLR